MPEPNSKFTARAEELFLLYLAQREEGLAPNIEEFCRAHAEFAHQLRAMDAAWDFASRLRPRSESLASSATRPRQGANADVAARGPTGDDPELAPDSPVELLRRLRSENSHGTRYQLLGEVARGGMGVILRVWDSELRRSLAMKVVRGDGERATGDTPSVDPKTLGRFLEEAQITGQLEHPGIVPVHELGLSADGRAFFTMRLVKGDDLRTIYAKVASAEDGWNEVRALNVVLKVCEAMSYAHSKGVLHRDLKPSNVMVGRFGEVYVMDWGLARVLGREDLHDLRLKPNGPATHSAITTERGEHRDLTPDSPLVTMDGDVVGTPSFMAPEQALGQLGQLGPHSDVYAAGAMLYQLIGGEAPYSPRGARVSPHTLLARVLEGPPRSLAELAPGAPAELVAVVEKAMAREIAERYPTMLALADDLRAFLEGRVVQAFETGAWAETKKWFLRNRALAASLTLVLFASTLGAVTSTSFAVEAKDQRSQAEASAARSKLLAEEARANAERALEQEQIAQRRSEELERITQFQSRSFALLEPGRFGDDLRGQLLLGLELSFRLSPGAPGAADAAREQFRALLERVDCTAVASHALESIALQPMFSGIALEAPDQPLVRAMLYESFGDTANSLGSRELASNAYREALADRRRLASGDRSKEIFVLNKLGVCLIALNREVEAEQPIREAVELAAAELGPVHRSTLASRNNLGQLLEAQGRDEEALALYREVVDESRSGLGNDDPDTLTATNNLASLANRLGRAEEAEALYLAVLEASRRTLGGQHEDTLSTLGNYALLLLSKRDLKGAERAAREVYLRFKELRGLRHPDVLTAMHNLALVLGNGPDPDEAERLYRECLELRREILGRDHPYTLQEAADLAFLLKRRGKFAEAEPLYREALAARRRTLGDQHPFTIQNVNNLGMLLFENNQLDEAESLLREALASHRAVDGELDPETLWSYVSLGRLLRTRGNLEEAERMFGAAFEGRLSALGDQHVDTWMALASLGATRNEAGQYEEAVRDLRRALEGYRLSVGYQHPYARTTALGLAQILVNGGRTSEAKELLTLVAEEIAAAEGQASEAYRSIRRALDGL